MHNWLVRRPRFHLHVTPASASWRNLIECWFVVLSWRRLERGVFTIVQATNFQLGPRAGQDVNHHVD